jgi:tetratricopeptide (TPR) repeat protein
MNKSLAAIAAGSLLLIAVLITYRSSTLEQESRAANEELLRQGIALFENQEYAQALDILNSIPASEDSDGQLLYYVGSSQMMLKDYRAAAQSLEQALVLDSHNAGILYALGVAHYKLGNLNLAKAYFASVLEINPDDRHAKGLMDIMAELEQQASAPADPAEPEDNDAQ